MSHFAKVLDGIVLQVIVAEPEFFDTFIDTSPGDWVQTSYNTYGGIHYGVDGQPDNGTPFRKNFAGIGFTYDKQLDAFIPPKPFNSWTLDYSTCLWVPPVEKPTDGNAYKWNEENQTWDLVETV